MALLERDIEKHLVDTVMCLQGQVRKVKWIGRNNAPDRRVMLPGMCFWVELKRPGEEPNPAQEREHARMRRCGEVVNVWSTFEQIDNFAIAYRMMRGQ